MRLVYRQTQVVIASMAALTYVVASSPLWAQSDESPAKLVRQTAENELSSNNNSLKFTFLDHKQTAHGSQARLIVETRQATVGMLVAINDKPLTPEQRHAEEAHLDHLLANPDELRKKEKSEKEDADHTQRIIKALPDAFLYEPDGREVGRRSVGIPGAELVRLKFRPNPSYHPPSRVEQVLEGMQGYLLIDAGKCRIAKIDGTLIQNVSFGWGILGHLDKGGHFLVEQGDIGEGVWEITRMNLDFAGKELLFKSFSVKSDETFSDFRPVPADLTFVQRVELLKKQEAELDQRKEGDPQ
jgi:hypothetical protein